MLDWDGMCYGEAKFQADWALAEFKLGGWIISRSSPRHYHIVFDRKTRSLRVRKIVARICKASRHDGLTQWFLNQLSRGEKLTLRTGRKGEKPPPRIISRKGSQDGEIKRYLLSRDCTKRIDRLSLSQGV